MSILKSISILLLIAILTAACAPTATVVPTPIPTEAIQATATSVPTESLEATTMPAPTETPLPVRNILTVKLKPGIKWSDGADLTAKDLVGTYEIMWAQQAPAWSYINDVKAIDDLTVNFYITTPSPRALRLILRAYQPSSYAVYGKWMDQAAKLRKDGKKADGPEAKTLIDDLIAFRPEKVVAYGPFVLDPGSVTEAQLEMVKNPVGFNADKIDLEKMLVYFGDTAASMPLVLAGEIDYSTEGYTPSNVEAILAVPNIKIINGPTGTGPGLWFNNAVYPFDKKEVRQAFAYIIDREENAKVAMGSAGKAIQYQAGFADIGVKKWLTEDTIAKLNPYKKDWAKAEELLKSIGFKKGADNIWLDDEGAPMKFELSVPADYADWLGAAENVSQQLNAFGFKTSVKGYPSAERGTVQKEGKYQILIDLGIYYNPPYPQASFNYYLNAPRNNPEAANGMYGYKFPWKQTLADGTKVDITELIKTSLDGLDPEAQKPTIGQLSLLVNDQLPVLALFERYATDPLNFGKRVDGWLDFNNPLYTNGQGGDNYISIQLLNGNLKRSATGDGSIHLVWPYPQPPTYNLNDFAEKSLTQNLGTVAYDSMYPPLFFYMWNTSEYKPYIAESYSLH
jgi:peptide/nickel transport system substrate-binding protein